MPDKNIKNQTMQEGGEASTKNINKILGRCSRKGLSLSLSHSLIRILMVMEKN